MFRNLLLIIFLALGLAVLLRLVLSIARGVAQLLGIATGEAREPRQAAAPGNSKQGPISGHLVRDPVSGTFIDEELAVKEVINGQTFYFESKDNRDAYLRSAHS